MVKWIKTNGEGRFNIDTGKIAVGGGSAGGYLAFTTGFNPQFSPDAIVAISAPTGFSTAGIEPAGDLNLLENIKNSTFISYGDYTTRMDLWRYLGINGLALYAIFGFDPVKEPHKLEPYTLTDNVRTGFPPTLIVHAKNDWLVNLHEADAFYKFLQEKKIESELYIVENGHDSVLIDRHPEAIDVIIRFLNKQYQRHIP
jgi:acetyl esterase/lipase